MTLTRSDLTPYRLRMALLRRVGMEIHPGAEVRSGNRFMGPHLALGDGVIINHDCFFENEQAKVTFAAGSGSAPRSNFLTATHELGPASHRWGNEVKRDIMIGEGTWVGAGVTVLPGVTIGRGCVIAAGAVVNEDCEPNGMYAGVPARRVKDLPDHSLRSVRAASSA